MAQYFSRKNELSANNPLIVGAISTAATLEGLSQVTLPSDECDVLELRLDSIDLPLTELVKHASHLPLPLLVTARHPDEGGLGHLTTVQRTALLEALLPHAAFMDIELRSATEMLPLVRKAQSLGVGVIGSFHDFNSTPASAVLQGAIEFGLQHKLDAVKIAAQLRGPDDMARLLLILGEEKRIPLSVMGMGQLGRVSRLLFAKCGSVLNYGYLGQSNAPGQWPARQLKTLMSEL
jgi:3-dehydroquinate dehydratase-1